ncbi:WD40-repeat-containing domain protein [Paraphysoderma sedebokerense]|nr:WD40-repeat-containing domain protein [Paraphysoderma sedebokerense]
MPKTPSSRIRSRAATPSSETALLSKSRRNTPSVEHDSNTKKLRSSASKNALSASKSKSTTKRKPAHSAASTPSRLRKSDKFVDLTLEYKDENAGYSSDNAPIDELCIGNLAVMENKRSRSKPKTKKNDSSRRKEDLDGDIVDEMCSLMAEEVFENIKTVSSVKTRSSLESQPGTVYRAAWGCVFEPQIPEMDHASAQFKLSPPSNVVATCGSNSVAFIDTKNNRMIARYTHDEDLDEEFYCIDWNVIPVSLGEMKSLEDDDTESEPDDDDEGSRRNNMTKDGGNNEMSDYLSIVATGGKSGQVMLMNYKQHQVYRYLQFHSGAIHCLKFSKNNPRWLFSASDDGYVCLWDIGLPHKRCPATILAAFNFRHGVTSFSLSLDETCIIGGSPNSQLLQFDVSWVASQSGMKAKDFEQFNVDVRYMKDPRGSDGRGYWVMEDGLEYEWSNGGNIDDIAFVDENVVASRACNIDNGFILWDWDQTVEHDVHVIARLEWENTSDSYLKFRVVHSGKSGTPHGDIHIFDLTEYIGGKRTVITHTDDNGSDNRIPKIRPSKILKTPKTIPEPYISSPSEKHRTKKEIRDQEELKEQRKMICNVCVSDDGTVIVGCTKGGMVFIWKKEG